MRDLAKPKRPQTASQKLASEENWARLQLTNIQVQAQKLARDGFLAQDELAHIAGYASRAEYRLVTNQRDRIEFKKKLKESEASDGKTK